MSRIALLRAAVCVLVLLSFAGCPGGSTIVGAWIITLSIGCEDLAPTLLPLYLYANGAASIPVGSASGYTGLWMLDGNAFTADVTLSTIDENLIFQAIVSGNTMTNGALSGDVTGCFTATKEF